MAKHVKAHRDYGDGSITARGPDTWRLRYRVGGRRITATSHGTRTEAQRTLRQLLKAADDGEHVAPSRMTLSSWAAQWQLLLARGETQDGRRHGQVTPRTRERYLELLTSYVLPALGDRRLQDIRAVDVDTLYIGLERRLSVTTVRHIHVALKACFAVAVRKGNLRKNPCDDADIPRPEQTGAGRALDAAELRRLIDGFRGFPLYPMVATAALTGCRLGELLALRHADLDSAAKTLRIERAIEETQEFGRILKEPKSRRGRRTIAVDDGLVALLLGVRERFLRLQAGVPDGARADLSMIKLPVDALMFPAPPRGGAGFDLSKLPVRVR
jgi:integrase